MNKLIVEELTPLQRERYNYLINSYEPESALELLSHLSPKGTNSWTSVQEKLSSIEQSNRIQKKFEDAMCEEFVLFTNYTVDEITQKVTAVRAAVDLPYYSRSIKLNSLNDFLNLFMIEKVYEVSESDTKKKEVGYKPVFKIKPDRV